MRNQIVI